MLEGKCRPRAAHHDGVQILLPSSTKKRESEREREREKQKKNKKRVRLLVLHLLLDLSDTAKEHQEVAQEFVTESQALP